MKVAVTCQDSEKDSPVDPRFGRARWIALVDTETGDSEIYDNAVNLNIAQGAGIQTAKRVIELGAVAVLTGHVGPKAFATLEAAHVNVFLARDVTVLQAVEALVRGNLPHASEPDVVGHWNS